MNFKSTVNTLNIGKTIKDLL